MLVQTSIMLSEEHKKYLVDNCISPTKLMRRIINERIKDVIKRHKSYE